MDKRDHYACTHTFTRDSARSIIIRAGKIAMIHSLKYDYYKFPGGGIEKGESPIDAMIRETREEAGLIIKPESIREYGLVHRVQKSQKDNTERFVQNNYYYICSAQEERTAQELNGYEAEEGYCLEFIEPRTAIKKNRSVGKSPYDTAMFEREARVIETLIVQGLLE